MESLRFYLLLVIIGLLFGLIAFAVLQFKIPINTRSQIERLHQPIAAEISKNQKSQIVHALFIAAGD